MTPGVSRGILEALDGGALTATSVMTTSRWWPESAAALKPFADRADIGLHLNLTLGRPLGSMPLLAPSGILPDIGAFIRRGVGNALPTDEIAVEIGRQMDCFEAVFGRPPDHVDGHQHVHVLALVRMIVLSALKTRGWRPWLRNSGDQTIRIIRRRATFKKALAVAVLSHGFASLAKSRDLDTNDGFAGFSNFDEGTDYGHLFSRYLTAPGARHLIMCHPGIVDAELRALDPVVATREQELTFLLSPGFREALAAAGASRIRLSSALVPAARTMEATVS